jgi:hypothetical protein
MFMIHIMRVIMFVFPVFMFMNVFMDQVYTDKKFFIVQYLRSCSGFLYCMFF